MDDLVVEWWRIGSPHCGTYEKISEVSPSGDELSANWICLRQKLTFRLRTSSSSRLEIASMKSDTFKSNDCVPELNSSCLALRKFKIFTISVIDDTVSYVMCPTSSTDTFLFWTVITNCRLTLIVKQNWVSNFSALLLSKAKIRTLSLWSTNTTPEGNPWSWCLVKRQPIRFGKPDQFVFEGPFPHF